MNNPLFPKVVAIIVLYEPDIGSLLKSLNSVLEQVDKVFLIDNSRTRVKVDYFSYSRKIDYHFLDSNHGIAYAQNLAFEMALKLEMEFAILLDQDSHPSPHLVSRLIREMSDDSVCAAGSIYHDSRSNTFSYFVTEKKGVPNKWLLNQKHDESSIEVAHLISSGTMVKLSCIKKIGGMRTNYFIDLVDTEWSFRARNNGYKIVGVPDAKIEHTLGDKVCSAWFFGWKQVSYHSPLRDYYIYRNSLLMLKNQTISYRWKIHFLWSLLQRFVYFLLIAPERIERLSKILLGIRHGINNTSGKLIDNNKVFKLPISQLDPP